MRKVKKLDANYSCNLKMLRHLRCFFFLISGIYPKPKQLREKARIAKSVKKSTKKEENKKPEQS
jgi:hypothetical protein